MNGIFGINNSTPSSISGIPLTGVSNSSNITLYIATGVFVTLNNPLAATTNVTGLVNSSGVIGANTRAVNCAETNASKSIVVSGAAGVSFVSTFFLLLAFMNSTYLPSNPSGLGFSFLAGVFVNVFSVSLSNSFTCWYFVVGVFLFLVIIYLLNI